MAEAEGVRQNQVMLSVKLREGKVVRLDGESQDVCAATGGLGVLPGRIRHKP